MIGQRLSDGPQQAFFVEGFEQASDRLRLAHQFFGLRIVPAADWTLVSRQLRPGEGRPGDSYSIIARSSRGYKY